MKYYITIGRVQDGPVSFIGVRKQNPQAGFGPELHTTLELPSREEKKVRCQPIACFGFLYLDKRCFCRIDRSRPSVRRDRDSSLPFPDRVKVLQSLHKALPSTTLYYKNCTKQILVLQSLHKLLPSTTLYYKACTKHSPVLLCTARVAQNTSQYYFVLQSLHKALPSTTLYYKACTKHFPVLLCTTKLAQSTAQYYFVLQKLHRGPAVLLCTTKLAL